MASLPLVMQWQWQPVPPTPQDAPLPGELCRDDALFQGITVDPNTKAAFAFSFPQLARQTPDPRFYRLIQQLNTPLLSLTTRDAGQQDYAYWGRERPEHFRKDFRWAHFWFFRDRNDGDLVVIEYGFEGGLTLRSTQKSADDRQRYYRALCDAMATKAATV